jgi:penicillin-binding protein 1C
MLARAPGSLLPPQVRLRALGTNARVSWLVNGALVGQSRGAEGFLLSFPTAGDQRITALTDDGAWAELRLRVLR